MDADGSKFEDKDARPRETLFTLQSSHARWKRASRETNRRRPHATEHPIMTGPDDKTIHCEESMTATTQKRGYPDENRRPRQQLATGKTYKTRHREPIRFYWIFFQLKENISLPSGGGHGVRVPGAPSPER